MEPLQCASAAAAATQQMPARMTTAQLEAAIGALHAQKQGLREAFDRLVASSPFPLPFRWDELDAHVSSVLSNIDARFSLLQVLEAPRPTPLAIAVCAPAGGRRNEESSSSEDEEMEDSLQKVEEEAAPAASAAAKKAPLSWVEVNEEAVEMEDAKQEEAAAANNSHLSTVQVEEEAAAAAAAAMNSLQSTVQVEEAAQGSPSPPGGATSLAAECASTKAARLGELVGKNAGLGQEVLARPVVTQPPPIPSYPVLQQQHMPSAPKAGYPVLRQQDTANAVNTGDYFEFRSQQLMGKTWDLGDLLPQKQFTATAPNAGDCLLQQQQSMGVANPTNADDLLDEKQPSTANTPHAGGYQPQERQQKLRGAVANAVFKQRQQQCVATKPTNAGGLQPQQQKPTANSPNSCNPVLQKRRRQLQRLLNPTDTSDLLPEQHLLTGNASNACEPLLQQQQQKKKRVAKPTNARNLLPPPPQQQHAAQHVHGRGGAAPKPSEPQRPGSGAAKSNMNKSIGINKTIGKRRGNGNPQFNKSKNSGQICYRCGCKGHWSRTCHAPEHLVSLYQQTKTEQRAKQCGAASTIYTN